LLFAQFRPFAILKPKNRKTEKPAHSVVGDLCFHACFSQLEPKPPSGGQTKNLRMGTLAGGKVVEPSRSFLGSGEEAAACGLLIHF
jgi:hypothetical protein